MRNYGGYKFDDLLEQDMWKTMVMKTLLEEEFKNNKKEMDKK